MSRSVANGHRDSAADSGRRLDKWLWYCRIVKSRTLAAGLVADGKVRVNRVKAGKPSHEVKSGDVLTIVSGPHVRILKVVALGERRGPPSEARNLYEDVTPPGTSDATPAFIPGRPAGAGRPTKRDRRRIERFTGDE